MSALVELSQGRRIALDGKSIRRGFEHAWDKSGMVHLVSARLNQGGNRIVFGQLAVEDKSNEITAIPKLLKLWPGLAGGSLALVERTRQDLGDLSGKITTERHYYISSLKDCSDAAAKTMAQYIRGHWAVENNLHWQLDMSFNEDQRRIRKGNGAENFSRLCRIALNLLKRDTSIKAGIKGKRLNAGWDHDYLLSLISQRRCVCPAPFGLRNAA